MHSRFARWLVMLVALVSLAGLVGASGALADSNVGAQNPSLAVSVSLTSSGASPATAATVGDTVYAAGSVTNQTDQRQRIRLAITLVGPGGVVYDASKNVVLAPHETVDSAASLVVSSAYATGFYTLTVSAGNAGGTSSASASIELY